MLKSLHERFLSRLVELLEEADQIDKTIRRFPGAIVDDWALRTTRQQPDYETIDQVRCIEWMTKCGTLIAQIVPDGNPNRALKDNFNDNGFVHASGFRLLKAKLRGVQDDFKKGFLDDTWTIIRAEVASDYLTQAEMLLRDGYHVPATVLGGAVLEDALRKLCLRQGIPLDLPNGKRKTIDPLNTDLVKASVYGTAKAHEIRGWTTLRNDAAHGNSAAIDPQSVKRMVEGICGFVADYLR